VNVTVIPKGQVWKRHIDQLCLRHSSTEDTEPPDDLMVTTGNTAQQEETPVPDFVPSQPRRIPRQPDGDEYTWDHPRRSTRT